MYIYVAFFSEKDLQKDVEKKFYMAGQNFEFFKSVFPDYLELNRVEVKGCIGFLKGKAYGSKNCYVLNINNVRASNTSLSFDYYADRELNVTSEFINKSLYKFAIQSDWINKENGFYPRLCILEKTDFDSVRKGTPNIRKLSSNSVIIDELKSKREWELICNLYEPLEKVPERGAVWNDANELYELAFACSKLGEPKNKMERDKEHLKYIKRYRDLSVTFYKRCYEIEPNLSRYASALAYRHYLNVMELTKPGGRRDGNVRYEISEALIWFDKALSINPKSINDYYRKGKLILDKQIDNFKYSRREFTSETFTQIEKMETTAVACLNKVINLYEELDSYDQRKAYRKTYIKALYSLGCYYIEKPIIAWNEFACYKLQKKKFNIYISHDDLKYISKARDIFEACFQKETNISLDDDLDCLQLLKASNEWAISPMDKLYRLGMVYLYIYFIKRILEGDSKKTENYGQKAEKYLSAAKSTGDGLKRTKVSRRDTWFIAEKLAWYYIFIENYNKAIQLIQHSHEGYIKNTYAIALMLSGSPDELSKAETVLNSEASNNKSKVQGTSLALLAHLYKLRGDKEKLESTLTRRMKNLSTSTQKLISILETEV